MKRALVLAITLAIAYPAFAQPDTSDCADSIPRLTRIIRNKYSQVFKPEVVGWFVGVWKKKNDIFLYGPVQIPIDGTQKFMYESDALRLCPQADGTFYLYNANKPSEYATIHLKSDHSFSVSDGGGRMSNLVDSYTKIGPQ